MLTGLKINEIFIVGENGKIEAFKLGALLAEIRNYRKYLFIVNKVIKFGRGELSRIISDGTEKEIGALLG